MVELSQIYQDIEAEQVRLVPYAIGFSPAALIQVEGRSGLFVDFDQCGSLRKLKEVLAHEMGHCATGCTHKLSSPHDLIEKHEYKANRWAFERYLPPAQLARAIEAGYTEAWQLAEWFDLPQPFVEKALAYYAGPKGLDLAAPCL